jgi:hypothetical protein
VSEEINVGKAGTRVGYGILGFVATISILVNEILS